MSSKANFSWQQPGKGGEQTDPGSLYYLVVNLHPPSGKGGSSGGHIFTLILTCCLRTFSWLKILWLKPKAARFWIALTRWRSWDLVTLRHVACLVLNCTSCVKLHWGVKRQKVATCGFIVAHSNVNSSCGILDLDPRTPTRVPWWCLNSILALSTCPCHVLKNI